MMLKWSHATDITNMGQINYFFYSVQNILRETVSKTSISNKEVDANMMWQGGSVCKLQ